MAFSPFSRNSLLRGSLVLALVAGLPAQAQEEPDTFRPSILRAKSADFTVQAVNQPDGSILVTYELKGKPTLGTVVKDGKTYHQLKGFKGLLTSGPKGFPETLSKQVNLLVDPRKRYTVELVDSEALSFPMEHPYLPSRGVIYRSQDPAKVPYQVHPEALRGGLYPAQVLEHADPFFIRNVSGLNLRFAVAQVDTTAQKAKAYTRLVFSVKPAETLASAAESEEAPSRRVTAEFHNVVKSMFLNVPQGGTRAAWPYELGDKGDMLVLYTARDAAAIQPYIDHKRARGFTVATQEVPVGTNVKSLIQQAYTANKNLLYVQLVGDFADIKCDTRISNAVGVDEVCPIDNALGRVAGGDNFFDLIIGRFSANSAAEVTTQVNKTLAYENNGKQDWWLKGLAMASAEGAGIGDDNEADIAHENVIKNNKLLAKGYTSVATAYDAPSTAPLSAATGPLNAGLGVVNYTGHGNHTYWVTTYLNTTNAAALTNGNKLPIIFSVACVVGQYNNYTSLAEAFLRNPNGGAIGAVMSTVYQAWTPPMVGQDYMNDLLTGGYNYAANPVDGTSTDHGKTTLGAVVFNALNLMLGESANYYDVECAESWVLFGDASLQVVPSTTFAFTNQPQSATVWAGAQATFSAGVSGGKPPYTYQWFRDTTPIPGATNPSYSLTTQNADTNARFSVVAKDASNPAVTLTSTQAILTVKPVTPLQVLTQPQPQSVPAGGTATFTVAGSGGVPPYSYTWLRNGAPMLGAPSAPSYSFTVQPGDDSTSYSATITDSAPRPQSVTTASAPLTVTIPALVITGPASQTVSVGATATFTVGVTGGKAPYTYQWTKNGVPVATTATYALVATTADDQAVIKVDVKDSASPANAQTSTTAKLTVVSVLDKIVNGTFEAGTTGWSGTTGAIGNWSSYNEPAYEGLKAAYLGGNGKTTTETLYQTVSIPSSATSATLGYYLHIDTKETSSSAYDKLSVKLRTASGSPLKTLVTYSNAHAAAGYQLRTFDLSAYKGQTVQIYFEMTEDSILATSFLVDKVSLLVK